MWPDLLHVKWKNIKPKRRRYTRQDAILYRLMYCLERMFGALPDGRLAKQPLADGVSPRQEQGHKRSDCGSYVGCKAGSYENYSNGTLYNQKFLPSALQLAMKVSSVFSSGAFLL